MDAGKLSATLLVGVIFAVVLGVASSNAAGSTTTNTGNCLGPLGEACPQGQHKYIEMTESFDYHFYSPDQSSTVEHGCKDVECCWVVYGGGDTEEKAESEPAEHEANSDSHHDSLAVGDSACAHWRCIVREPTFYHDLDRALASDRADELYAFLARYGSLV